MHLNTRIWSAFRLVILSLFLCSKASAEIPLSQTPGLYEHFNSEFKSLSPLYGFVHKNKIENSYRYLQSQKGTQDPAHVQLLRELFHEVDPVNLRPTELGANAATYLTPHIIATFLPTLKNEIQKIKKNKSLSKKEKVQLVEKLRNLVTSNPQYQQSIQSNKIRYEQSLHTLQKLTSLPSPTPEDIQEISRQNGLIKKYNPKINSRLNIDSSLGRILNSLVETIEQGISQKNPEVSEDFVFDVLNKFVWDKIDSKPEMLVYLKMLEQQFHASEPSIDIFRNDKPLPQGDFQEKQWCDQIFTHKDELAPSLGNFQSENLEKSLFQLSLLDQTKGPDLYNTGHCKISDQSYSDCGETSLRNFINIVIYDKKTKKFDVNFLKQLAAEGLAISPQLIRYYEIFDTNEKQNNAIKHQDVIYHPRNEWGKVMRGLPEVKYRIASRDEIDAGQVNMQKAITGLLGVSDWSELGRKFSTPERPINFEPMNENFGSMAFNVQETSYKWYFQPKHFYIEKATSLKSSFNQNLFELLWNLGYKKTRQPKYRDYLTHLKLTSNQQNEIWQDKDSFDFIINSRIFAAEEKFLLLDQIFSQMPISELLTRFTINLVNSLPEAGDYRQRMANKIIEEKIHFLYPFVNKIFPDLLLDNKGELIIQILRTQAKEFYHHFSDEIFQQLSPIYQGRILAEITSHPQNEFYKFLSEEVYTKADISSRVKILSNLADPKNKKFHDFLIKKYDSVEGFNHGFISYLFKFIEYMSNSSLIAEFSAFGRVLCSIVEKKSTELYPFLMKKFSALNYYNRTQVLKCALKADAKEIFPMVISHISHISAMGMNTLLLEILKNRTSELYPLVKKNFANVPLINQFWMLEIIAKEGITELYPLFLENFESLSAVYKSNLLGDILSNQRTELYHLVGQHYESLKEYHPSMLLFHIPQFKIEKFYPILRENFSILHSSHRNLAFEHIIKFQIEELYDLILDRLDQVDTKYFPLMAQWYLKRVQSQCTQINNLASKGKISKDLNLFGKISENSLVQNRPETVCHAEINSPTSHSFDHKILDKKLYPSEISYLQTLLSLLKVVSHKDCFALWPEVKSQLTADSAKAILEAHEEILKEKNEFTWGEFNQEILSSLVKLLDH